MSWLAACTDRRGIEPTRVVEHARGIERGSDDAGHVAGREGAATDSRRRSLGDGGHGLQSEGHPREAQARRLRFRCDRNAGADLRDNRERLGALQSTWHLLHVYRGQGSGRSRQLRCHGPRVDHPHLGEECQVLRRAQEPELGPHTPELRREIVCRSSRVEARIPRETCRAPSSGRCARRRPSKHSTKTAFRYRPMAIRRPLHPHRRRPPRRRRKRDRRANPDRGELRAEGRRRRARGDPSPGGGCSHGFDPFRTTPVGASSRT